MPLLKEWEVGATALAAIWKADEPEQFFSDATGISSDIKNEKRRIEHLAGRFLLKHLQADFPLHHISKDIHDKPRLADNEYFFSISHSWPYIAAVIDPYSEAGIDIQTWNSRIQSIQHKYLSEEEQEFFKNDPKLLTMAWCAKEAAYKWNGKRGVDFIEHLPIEYFDVRDEFYEMNIYLKVSPVPQMIFIESIIDTDFACSYISKAQDWAIY